MSHLSEFIIIEDELKKRYNELRKDQLLTRQEVFKQQVEKRKSINKQYDELKDEPRRSL